MKRSTSERSTFEYRDQAISSAIMRSILPSSSSIREELQTCPAQRPPLALGPTGMLFLRGDLLRIVFRVDVGEAERTCTLYLELRRALHEPVVAGLAGQEVE